MRQDRSNWKALAIVALFLAVVVGVTAPEAQAAGRRVVADMYQPFVINNQLFESGRLSVQVVASYTPGTELTKLWVDNECLGYFLTTALTDEVGTQDLFIFDRQADGNLDLIGFQLLGEPEQALYTFRTVARGGEWLAPVASNSALPAQVASR